jgi:phosphoribosylformimino-5-aminoimidazole carboxamide ribotide isomerase
VRGLRVWDVYPAIDLRGGRVVRLRQGDPTQETEYSQDPLGVARRWRQTGAVWVHVVNLDGAFGEGSRANLEVLDGVLKTGLLVQFGGGLRDIAGLREVLGLGVTRAVLGTAAVRRPELVRAALDEFGPQKIAVGIDAREGRVRIRGWRETTSLTPEGLGEAWAAQGVRWLIFTDVARDGMGSGLNVAATAHLAEVTGLQVIASGGVRSLADVQAAYDVGLSGVVIGRAIYDGGLRLAEALRVGTGTGTVSASDGSLARDLS